MSKRIHSKSFVCEACGVGQQVTVGEKIPYSKGRNYPQGYFENQ